MVGLFKRLGCVVGRHSPSRRAVQYKGHLKTGPCKHCGRELEKRGDGRWMARKVGAESGSLRQD